MSWPRYVIKGDETLMLLTEHCYEYRVPIPTPVISWVDEPEPMLTPMHCHVWTCIGKVGEYPDVWAYRYKGVE